VANLLDPTGNLRMSRLERDLADREEARRRELSKAATPSFLPVLRTRSQLLARTLKFGVRSLVGSGSHPAHAV
jgi:hypothetical protein